MRQALKLAESSIGLTDPNPRVGCVIVDSNYRVIGKGHTQERGGAHAEAAALQDAAFAGESVVGSTAYVTLEPCCHQGRTPPCTRKLIGAGVKRVVAALRDPNPVVSGKGFMELRQANVDVFELGRGKLADEAYELNIGFFSRMLRRRPWVRVKAAVSLDGKTALKNGESKWITSDASRIDGQSWRSRAGAILTGIGTVLKDDPGLEARFRPRSRQPLRAIVDSKLLTPLSALALRHPGAAVIYTAESAAERETALIEKGAEIKRLPGSNHKVNLAAVVEDLTHREINEVHVEACEKLIGSLLEARLVDELLIYVAPLLLGPGNAIGVLPHLVRLQDCIELTFHSVTLIGTDLRIVARHPDR
jgi:diaminohydroxyphosphoribosylaminopyrimidine deaminase/5-amino-6-(5-phosphoribosylamino)uracil reductase